MPALFECYVRAFGEYGDSEENELTEYFDRVEAVASYNHWYFGHYHADGDLDGKHSILYDNLIRVGTGAQDDLGRARAFQIGQKVRILADAVWGPNKPDDTDKEIEGTVKGVDRMGGGFYFGSEPTADVLGKNHHLYKHIPFSALSKVEQ